MPGTDDKMPGYLDALRQAERRRNASESQPGSSGQLHDLGTDELLQLFRGPTALRTGGA